MIRKIIKIFKKDNKIKNMIDDIYNYYHKINN